ncbi:hypothetical protein E4U42_000236 [Claviceps africana]|uniref:Uncharacterized protein n=1 Tax=Claviceps africana TaxID=83212 RepID=A0A8K0J5N0_9HYPO|nr:hypothetical protein E4U42_000236 [Claviceps africana]
MADAKNQSRRSSSLQRMLDLEKQYMTERQHSQTTCPRSTAQATVPVANPQPSPDPVSLLARPVQGHAYRRGGDHRRGTSLPPQLPPLVINKTTTIHNNTSLTVSPSELLMNGSPGISPDAHPDSATATPREKYTKVVAFEFPAKEVARCHSPSWEAYERRKIEKKMEKKERGEARKDGTKRLSKKPPPSSSPKALQQALASEADVARGRGRERAQHAAAASGGPGHETKPGRKARSRSNSFVSMLRAPFEFRRSASTDPVSDSGFIGGIKLELERHAHQQQILDSNAVEDESNVHPALRKNNLALRSPPDSPGTPGGGPDQRRYPPITRGAHHRQQTAPLAMPVAAPATPHDASTIDKWRSRVGLKAGSRPQSLASSGEESQPRGPGGARGTSVEHRQPEQHLSSALQSPTEQQLESPTIPLSSSKPARVAFAAASSTTPPLQDALIVAPAGEPEKQSENRPPRKHSNNESVSSTSSAATGYKTAPSSPPPEPPQRSSRRLSTSSSGESVPPVPPLTPQQHHQHHLDARAAPRDVKPPAPRSFPLCGSPAKPRGRQSRREWAEGATPASTAAGQMSPYLSSPTSNGHVPTSSSEESCDEDFFHSASSLSTPATSRPQSEREMPLTCGPEDATPASVHDAVRACFSRTYPLPSSENSEDEGGVDPIQAAAEKVLAVFNEIPVRRPDVGGRRTSQASLAADASLEPSAPATRPKSRSTDRRSGLSAAGRPLPSSPPACYLDQARKQPPAPAPTRAHRQRFGPPSSFVLPADGSGGAAPDPARRHLRHKSTPQIAGVDGGPVAKVFVECCSCAHYHDLPGALYKAMSDPEGVLSPADRCGYAGALSMTVRCCWCKHEMSVRCCAALSTKVYIQERLHV